MNPDCQNNTAPGAMPPCLGWHRGELRAWCTVHGVALIFEGGGMRNSYSAGA